MNGDRHREIANRFDGEEKRAQLEHRNPGRPEVAGQDHVVEEGIVTANAIFGGNLIDAALVIVVPLYALVSLTETRSEVRVISIER